MGAAMCYGVRRHAAFPARLKRTGRRTSLQTGAEEVFTDCRFFADCLVNFMRLPADWKRCSDGSDACIAAGFGRMILPSWTEIATMNVAAALC